ncbi:hypothetical protein [Streptomyces albidus (ex Kaewkla and Franco 2022)]|nr:hypothetical protein [Streptomyces albidus (ex Kaewkla and Franco 2022)]
MLKVVRTLVICSLLIAGAVSPVVAADHAHTGAVTASGIHVNDTTDGHTP